MEENIVGENHIKSNKKGKPVLIVALIVVILLIGGIAYYFGVLTNPVNIYKGVVSSVIDSLFEETVEANGKQGLNIEYDLTLNLEDEELNKIPTVKALNAIDATFDIQADNDTKDFVIHIDSTYDNEKLLNASMFMNLENSKAYIYAKEYIDKYLEIDLASDNNSTETTGIMPVKIKNIIKKEFENIITEDMCSKENGAYILRTTNIELLDNMVNALESLTKNEEFLKASTNSAEFVKVIETYMALIDTNSMEECAIEIILDLSFTFNPEKVIVKVGGESPVELLVNFGDNKLNFDVKLENEKIVDGEIVIRDDEKTEKIKMDLEVNEFGRTVLELKITPKDIKVLDKVNINKVIKTEEMSFDETMELLSNIEESKLGRVITEISEYNNSTINKANETIIKADLANLKSELTLEYANICSENYESQNKITQQEANNRYAYILTNYPKLIEIGCTVYADSELIPIVIEPEY